jgi:subtilisin family serine protease
VRVLRLLVPSVAVAALAVALTGVSPPAGAEETVPTARASVVTLVTGDRVVLGEHGEVSVRPGAGRTRMSFATSMEQGHLMVVPADAVGLVGSGWVDRRLFDVTALRDAGYDDAHADELPLIAQYDGSGGALAAPSGSRHVRTIPGAYAAALRAPKRTVSDFWRQLAAGKALRGNVTKLWLDGRRSLSLDSSVPQIGAPELWRAGYTGAGVTVAVLDSGIDATHPDLAGQIAAVQDFTGSVVVGDPVGHGTHVASTIAGTGAVHRGVAPGAKLLDGRVCEPRGCPESAILAGMQWAAEKGARVVNMSLGQPDVPGVDLVEEAVNRLSAEHNMLFVVAAGNDGGHRPVSSPSTADAALSVGAVDKSDRMADFSSRGPRPGDGVIKPDVTAPGVDIVAARSSTGVIGTPVGDRYTKLNGTSMAAPHVAGAASLLVNAHPDWPATRVKAALTGTAMPAAGVSPFAQGTGRIDVAKAVKATVTAEPVSLGLGTQLWPHDDDPELTRTVTYHNSGKQPVSLDLAVEASGPDGRPAPARMFTLSAASLTVPAGGDASVTFTAETSLSGAADGWYTGRVTATGGGATVSMPLAVEREAEAHTITLRHLGRDGKPTSTYDVSVAGYDMFVNVHPYDASGTASVRLPAGRYLFTSWIAEPEGGQSMLVQPWVDLTHGDATVTLDARKAKPIGLTVPAKSARMMFGLVQYHANDGAITGGLLAGESFDGLSIGHVGAAASGRRFATVMSAHFAEPGAAGDFADSRYRYNVAFCGYGRMFDGFQRTLRADDFVEVPQRDLQPGDARLTTLGISSAPGSAPPGGISWDYPIVAAPNAARTEYFTTGDVRWWQTYSRFRVEGEEWTPLATEFLVWQPIRAGETRWGAPVIGPALPTDRPQNATRTGDNMRFDLYLFAPGLPKAGGVSPVTATRTALYRDGALVAESSERPGELASAVPGPAATYRLEAHATRDATPLSTRIDATWTFRSGTTPDTAPLPLMAVRLGQAERGSRLPVWVDWMRPGEATIKKLTVDVSYDDGAHWQPANLTPRNDGWVANPQAGTGYVSIRTHATDSLGNSVDQTIIRAYSSTG